MITPLSPSESILSVAQERFGYERLHPGQQMAIEGVLSGRDTLAVMPTGSGKSAIYQIAGLLMPGATVVVSPLIALQRDQMRAISDVDAGDAAEVNSTVKESAREEAFDGLARDGIEFLFLAPEQFANEETMEKLCAARPSLFVVDEAHCMTEWGHDFRPDYLRLGAMVELLGHPTVLALTATAAPPVRDEIVERLGMRDPLIVVQGFNRPNISLAVKTFEDEDDKRDALLDRVVASEKPGIVYAATRASAEDLAKELVTRGVNVAAYHAGLKKSEREAVQTWFMDEDQAVIVATVAFGMGIDKPNVRFVHHYDVSGSLDSYYQEIGRAGRDDEPAEAVLFYRPKDLGLRRFQAGAGQLDVEQVELLVEAVLAHDGPVEPTELREETGLTESKLTKALGRLEDAGVTGSRADGQIIAIDPDVDPSEAADQAAEAQKNLSKFGQSRVEMMRQYAEQQGCRRGFLLNYFGEEFSPHAGIATTAGMATSSSRTRPPARFRSTARSSTPSGAMGR